MFSQSTGRLHETKLTTAGNNITAPLPPIVRRAPDGHIELIPRQRAVPSKKVSVASGSNISGGPGFEALVTLSSTAAANSQRAGHKTSVSTMNPPATSSGKAAARSSSPQAALPVNAEELLAAMHTVQEDVGQKMNDGFERLERISSAADSTVTTALAKAYGRKRSRSRHKTSSSDRSQTRSRNQSQPNAGRTASKSNRRGTGIKTGNGTVTVAVTRSMTPATPTPKPASSTPTPTHLVPKVSQTRLTLMKFSYYRVQYCTVYMVSPYSIDSVPGSSLYCCRPSDS